MTPTPYDAGRLSAPVAGAGPVRRIVIVGRTKMGEGSCVGGMTEETGQPVRLLPVGGYCHAPDPVFQLGEIWEMHVRRRAVLDPPHMEDHDEWDARKVGVVADLAGFVSRLVRPVSGEREALFEGRLRFRSVGTGYLPKAGPLPSSSVGFWIAPRLLIREDFEGRARYVMLGGRRLDIPYVGYEAPVLLIPAGTLIRVSLARWWVNPRHPEEGETCSLQISGWLGLSRAVPKPARLPGDDMVF